jgi:hypothetical protein
LHVSPAAHDFGFAGAATAPPQVSPSLATSLSLAVTPAGALVPVDAGASLVPGDEAGGGLDPPHPSAEAMATTSGAMAAALTFIGS